MTEIGTGRRSRRQVHALDVSRENIRTAIKSSIASEGFSSAGEKNVSRETLRPAVSSACQFLRAARGAGRSTVSEQLPSVKNSEGAVGGFLAARNLIFEAHVI